MCRHTSTPHCNRNRAIFAESRAHFNQTKTPRVGDLVRFTDGKTAYISHDWFGESVQTSAGGSYHLSRSGHVSMSGGLDSAFPTSLLTLSEGETALLTVWFFDHDYPTAGGGITRDMTVRVYEAPFPSTCRPFRVPGDDEARPWVRFDWTQDEHGVRTCTVVGLDGEPVLFNGVELSATYDAGFGVDRDTEISLRSRMGMFRSAVNA